MGISAVNSQTEAPTQLGRRLSRSQDDPLPAPPQVPHIPNHPVPTKRTSQPHKISMRRKMYGENRTKSVVVSYPGCVKCED